MPDIADKIRKLRRDNGIRSQKKLAILTGIPISSIGMWESGKRIPKYENLQKICDSIGIAIETLVDTSINSDLSEWIYLYNQLQADQDRKDVIDYMKYRLENPIE